MEVVNSNLDGTLSLVDKTWNDAMETAARHCEVIIDSLYAANGDSDSWVWEAGRQIEQIAKDLRAQKRKMNDGEQ